MNEPTPPQFDKQGDPTEETLEIIATWPGTNWADLMSYTVDCWNEAYGSVQEVSYNVHRFATGGWSANESVISAMKRNYLFWTCCWESSHRGGLHYFKIPKP